MLEQLINEIRLGGSLETNKLAIRLGTSPELVRAMLEHLQRLGMIKNYADCTDGCGGCTLQESCRTRPPIRLWKSVDGQ
ncbi:MAG TPA: FeoC-like transcriptional regulator [Anaerolineales bacterium]